MSTPAMIFTIAILITIAAFISGCTSHAVMVNGAGVPVDCRFTAIGPFSAAIGASAQSDCIKRYEALGFARRS